MIVKQKIAFLAEYFEGLFMLSFGDLISALSLYKTNKAKQEERRERAIRDLYTAIIESKSALNDINENISKNGRQFSSEFERRRERYKFIDQDRLRLVALHWAQAEVSLKYFDHDMSLGSVYSDWGKVQYWLEGLKTPEAVLRFRRATLQDAEIALKKLMEEQFE
ncbi:hypothetical protein KUL152_05250 [Tenacibaculum sp. KUL152]|nr:hypothetical protein KUL152_05250 [Tenacibaculum sp. KUL152]